jgi:hypothetical protein
MNNLCMLSINIPIEVEDSMIDWLLEQEEVEGFNSIKIHGHGTHEIHMALFEKVTGKSQRIMYQTHLSKENAQSILSKLKRDFAKNDIHYMVFPLLEAGNLMFLNKR